MKAVAGIAFVVSSTSTATFGSRAKKPLAARLLNRAKRGAAVAAAIAAPLALQACMGTAPYEGDFATDAGTPQDDAGRFTADPGLADDGGIDANPIDDDASADASQDDAGDGG